MVAQSYGPKSQVLRLGAWTICVLALIAIHTELGWRLSSGGPPLAALVTLALFVYLSSGVRVHVDRRRNRIGIGRRVLGIPLWSSTRDIGLEAVELRAAWMAGRYGVRMIVYDLVAVGREQGGRQSDAAAIDLREDLVLFRRAESGARGAARALNLPLVMRWDGVLDDEPPERREPGELVRPLAYPAALRDWRSWT